MVYMCVNVEFLFQKLVDQNEQVTIKTIHEAIKLLKGAITIVYPMNLPPHDPIRLVRNLISNYKWHFALS